MIAGTTLWDYIVGGYFNTILDLSKKSGGLGRISRDMLDFRDFVHMIGVVDCKPSEGWFT